MTLNLESLLKASRYTSATCPRSTPRQPSPNTPQIRRLLSKEAETRTAPIHRRGCRAVLHWPHSHSR